MFAHSYTGSSLRAHTPGPPTDKKQETRVIYLIPVGTVERDFLAHLSSQIKEAFSFPVRIGEVFLQLDYTYNARRGQYQSNLLLRRLQKLNLEGTEKILGVVDLDLYAPGLNLSLDRLQWEVGLL